MIAYSCYRKIKILNGNQSQTIKIYTKDLINRQYDYIVTIHGINNFVNGKEIETKSFKKLKYLLNFLKNDHHGIVKKTPDYIFHY